MPSISVRAISSREPAPRSTDIPVELVVAGSLCLFVSIASVCARLFTKIVDLRRVHADDYLIASAGAGFVSFTTLLFVGASYGLGSHKWEISTSSLKRALLYSNVLDVLYAPTMLAAKLAILIQIDRLFSGTRRKVIYWGARILAALNVLCYTAIFFIYVFECSPRAKIFDPSVPGKCISQGTAILASAATNVASGVAILLFAMWGVARLRLYGKRQMLVALIVVIGSFACGASICRLIYGFKVDSDGDFTDTILPVHLWQLSELTTVIYIACCPTFPRLIQYSQGVPASRAPTRNGWASVSSSQNGSSMEVLKDEKFPTIRVLGPTPNSSPNPAQSPVIPSSPDPEKPLPRTPVPREALLHPTPMVASIPMHQLPISAHSPQGRERATSYFAPSERPISHLSYESRATNAIDEILNSYNPSGMPATPLSPTMPPTPTTLYSPTTPGRFSRFSRFSRITTIFEDAVHMKIMPVYFAKGAATKTAV